MLATLITTSVFCRSETKTWLKTFLYLEGSADKLCLLINIITLFLANTFFDGFVISDSWWLDIISVTKALLLKVFDVIIDASTYLTKVVVAIPVTQ